MLRAKSVLKTKSVLKVALALSLLFGVITSGFAAEKTDLSKLSFDARLTGYQYPFEVKMHKFSSQSQQLEMAYMFLKGNGSKPVVTLLHGKNFNGAYWEKTARLLLAEGYSVFIPDQVGFGKSSKPYHYQFSFAGLANNTRGLLRALHIDKTIVVGHSLGGMLATRFALMYPGVTTKLVLVNPVGLEDYLRYSNYKDTEFFYKYELSRTSSQIMAYQKKNYYDGKWSPRYEALMHYLIGQFQGPDRALIAWNNALTYDMVFTQPVVNEFQNLQVPTALIIGTRDRTGPGRNWLKPGVVYEFGRYDQLGDKAAALIPDATLYKLEDLGHLPHIEGFERFKPVFLKALK